MSERESDDIRFVIGGLLLSTIVFASLWWNERAENEPSPPALVVEQRTNTGPDGLCPLEGRFIRDGELFVWDSFRRCFERAG